MLHGYLVWLLFEGRVGLVVLDGLHDVPGHAPVALVLIKLRTKQNQRGRTLQGRQIERHVRLEQLHCRLPQQRWCRVEERGPNTAQHHQQMRTEAAQRGWAAILAALVQHVVNEVVQLWCMVRVNEVVQLCCMIQKCSQRGGSAVLYGTKCSQRVVQLCCMVRDAETVIVKTWLSLGRPE